MYDPTFRTSFSIPSSPNKISYQHKLLFIGSCFTENIGSRLKDLAFQVEINPLGILFNPLSIITGIEMIIGKRHFTEKELFHFDNKWISFHHHSEFSGKDKKLTYEKILSRLTHAREYLTDGGFLFITWGTAWVYKWKETGKVVANCHKIPNHLFNKELLEVSEILLHYEQLLDNLWENYPQLSVIFTLSPVRHWKDGVEQNQVSKSTLRLAAYKLCQMYEQAMYFPAYEWMMDDLRDYRFYKEDMLHPNTTAIRYLWSKFEDTFFNPETQKIYQEIEKLNKFLGHKPSDPQDPGYVNKLWEVQERLKELKGGKL